MSTTTKEMNNTFFKKTKGILSLQSTIFLLLTAYIKTVVLQKIKCSFRSRKHLTVAVHDSKKSTFINACQATVAYGSTINQSGTSI